MDINTTKKLNNGVEIPFLGLGVFQSPIGKKYNKSVAQVILR